MTPEERFDQNQRLVHYVYTKHFQQDTEPWKEDIIQEGFIALWRACCAYDETKGFEFSTLACNCIYRAMIRYNERKVMRHSEVLSFAEVISEDADGNQIHLGDCMPDATDQETLEISDLLESVLTQCSKRVQQVSRLTLQGYKQEEVGNILGIGQSTVARDWEKFKRKFKRCLEETK